MAWCPLILSVCVFLTLSLLQQADLQNDDKFLSSLIRLCCLMLTWRYWLSYFDFGIKVKVLGQPLVEQRKRLHEAIDCDTA